jgi:predicted regulator of Ras-like GTPase activity (Roadblock/LC7/MglB family)
MKQLLDRLSRARTGVYEGRAFAQSDQQHQLMLRERQERLQELVARLGQETVASVVMLVDDHGQAVAHWYRHEEIDVVSIAALTAGSVQARQLLSAHVGARSQQSSVVHEYDGQIVALTRVDEHTMLLVVLEDLSRLGWARVALKRASVELAQYTGDIARP